jgi:hypothetical protein
MTHPAWDDDETLLADLAAALNDIAPMRDAVAERGRGAYTWRTIDDELALAGISFDSMLETASDLRDGDDGAPRVLIFDAEGISVELEVAPDRVAGQILPPSAGQILVEMQDAPEATITVEADDLGFFVLPSITARIMRLRCETSTARLVTEWVRL